LSRYPRTAAGGDELGRTHAGNNNVYAQDKLTWIDWHDTRDHGVLTEFTARLTALRAAHPVFRRQRFFQGRPIYGSSMSPGRPTRAPCPSSAGALDRPGSLVILGPPWRWNSQAARRSNQAGSGGTITPDRHVKEDRCLREP
jgi:hypothetical protein